MRKGYTKLTKEDFADFPVWELQGSLTTAEPYKDKIPFKADRFRAFFVRTAFTLADKTKMTGWTMICVPPYELHSLSPTILTGDGPVDLTKLAKQPKRKDIERACSRIGRTVAEIFPLEFQTDVPVPDGPARGRMTGFLHRFQYEDDNGWRQHIDIVYRTASEVDAAINQFQEKEAARKAALKPSADEQALIKAAKAGHVAKLKSLLAKGVDFNRGGILEDGGYTRKKVTALMLAAGAGQEAAVRALLETGAAIHAADDTNEPRQSNSTALAYACRAGQTEVARLLLEAGADPNHRLSYGHTILDESCYEAPLELIRLLLAHGGDPNASCGKSDYFALRRAVSSNRLDVVQLLLENGADVNGVDDDGETPLIYASRGLRLEIVRLLLEKGASVSSQTQGKLTTLHRVVISLSDLDPELDAAATETFAQGMQIVRLLLENGADLNAVSKYADTPRSLAKNCKFPGLLTFLNKAAGE
ncbi:MAG TPA: ankyrin repeat domain-containing protein [Verrucomicrobiae bacterium]